jgi:hypothetical protein
LAVFDDPNLLKKSVEYAINPPLVVMTSNNMTPINKSKPTLTPSFREIAKFKMSDVQKETMKALIDDDNKIEKLRGGKISITMDDEKNENGPKKAGHQFKFKQNERVMRNKANFNANRRVMKSYYNRNYSARPSIQNGPIDTSNFKLNSPYSFLEMGVTSQMMTTNVKYTQPISVLMKLPSEPDPKIKKEIGNLEKKREDFESKLFKKAKEEFKLITALTKKELQLKLNHELLPFFVVSKGSLKGINEIITNTVPSQTKSKGRFLELDQDELNKKFPLVNSVDSVALNKHVYSRILNFFLNDSEVSSPSNKDQNQNLKTIHNSIPGRKVNLRTDANRTKQSPERRDLLNSKVEFDYQKCIELTQKLKNLDCNRKDKDYNQLNDYLHTSFLEMKAAGDDLINVKFSASDEPYPTIEKLIAQMMTRRDLAEKFERLKILEFESHLQKAENEMIQDILHENIYRIMAFFGPSIEGMKEHIH